MACNPRRLLPVNNHSSSLHSPLAEARAVNWMRKLCAATATPPHRMRPRIHCSIHMRVGPRTTSQKKLHLSVKSTTSPQKIPPLTTRTSPSKRTLLLKPHRLSVKNATPLAKRAPPLHHKYHHHVTNSPRLDENNHLLSPFATFGGNHLP